MKDGQRWKPKTITLRIMHDDGKFYTHRFVAGSLLPDPIARSRVLSPGTKRVFARLALDVDEDGSCCPRIDALAEALALNRSTVRRAINQLIEHNLIETSGAKQGPNRRYHFIWSEAIQGRRRESQT